MLAEAHFLLVDVVFLQIEYHLLLEPRRIRLLLKLFQTLGADSVDSLVLERLYTILKLKDIADTACNILVECLSLT